MSRSGSEPADARDPRWRRNVFAVTTATFIGFTGFTLVMPFLPLFIRELGVSDVADIALWTGAILGVTPAVTALMSPIWGRLADRYGRKIMIVRSLASCIVIMAAMSLVSHPWHAFALRAALGFLTGYGSLALSMAAESAPRPQMAAAIGAVQTAQRLAPAVGPVVGGALAALVGLRAAFLVAASFYAVALVVVLALYREQRSGHAHQSAAAGNPVSFRSVLAFENFLLLMGVIFGFHFVDRSMGPILPLYLEQLGVGPARVEVAAGLLFSTSALSGAIGHHVSGRLLARFSPRVVISMSAGLSAGGAIVLAAGGPFGFLAAGTMMFGLGVGAALTAAYTAAGSVIPSGSHGAGFGVLSSASLSGVAVSPIASGFIGGTTLRGVFVLDVVAMGLLALVVRRVMVDRAPVASALAEDA